MKSIFEDNDYNFASFITSTTHEDGYAALIYHDNLTDDYSEKEQAIQSLFYHYIEPKASSQVGDFIQYVGAKFFIGRGITPMKALADATEQCEAYYKAMAEGVQVHLLGGRVSYVFPLLDAERQLRKRALPIEIDGVLSVPKSAQEQHGPYTELKGVVNVTGLDELMKGPDVMLPVHRRLDGLEKKTEEEVASVIEELKGRGMSSAISKKLLETMDAQVAHTVNIETPKFLKDAKVGSPIRTNEQRWAAYHKGETTVGDALLMLDVLATAAAKEAGAFDDKVKIHPNLGSALQNIYFSNAILNYRELSVALMNWEAGNEINSKYRYLFKAILNNIKHGEDVRAVIDGFLRFVSSNTPADMHKFELVMRAVKSLQADNDIQETIKIMTAKFKGSFDRAKPTSLGGTLDREELNKRQFTQINLTEETNENNLSSKIKKLMTGKKPGDFTLQEAEELLYLMADASILEEAVKYRHGPAAALEKLEHIRKNTPKLSHSGIMDELVMFRNGWSLNSSYERLYRAIHQSLPPLESVEGAITGFVGYLVNGLQELELRYNLVMNATKVWQIDREALKAAQIKTDKPNAWDLLDTDVRAHYNSLAAEELDDDSDSETE